MNFRKITYNETGLIDCEYDHPVLGTIPATLSPDDPETADQFADIIAGNHGAIAAYVAPVKTAEELAAQDLATEQAWVLAEIKEADVEVRKFEDGAARARGASVTVWRTYRNELRDYIQGGTIVGVRPTSPEVV